MLKEQLQQEFNQALKSGDQSKRLLLGMALAAIKNRELAKRSRLSKTLTDVGELERQSQLTDEEAIEVIAGEMKKRKEAIEQYIAGGRAELAQKEKAEMDLLSGYLPEQLSEEELKAEVLKAISELGAGSIRDLGKVVGAVMGRVKGKADGGSVSRLAKELLAK